MIKRKCLICGKEFWTHLHEIKRGWGKFCSRKCSYLGKRIRLTRECLICGEKFQIIPSHLKKGGGKYCSYKCSGISKLGKPTWIKGKHLYKKTKKKLSKANKGKHNSPNTEFKRGNQHPCWGNGHSKSGEGYVLIYSPNHPFCNNCRYVREHRLVAEKYLGRYLTKEEIIHHINGILDDNRPENLYLFNKSEHTIFENLKNKPKLKSNLLSSV